MLRAFASRLITPARGDVDRRIRTRGEKAHCGTMTPAGWPYIVYREQTSEGKCRPGYAIGLASSTLRVPCHLLQRPSKFARKLAERNPGGEVFAFSDMIDSMALLREFRAPVADLPPGMAEMGACESPLTHLRDKKTIAAEHLARNIWGLRRALAKNEPDHVSWLPGPGNPAGGLTEVTRDVVPLLRMFQSGSLGPGAFRAEALGENVSGRRSHIFCYCCYFLCWLLW